MMIILYSLLLTTVAVGGGYLVGEWVVKIWKQTIQNNL